MLLMSGQSTLLMASDMPKSDSDKSENSKCDPPPDEVADELDPDSQQLFRVL